MKHIMHIGRRCKFCNKVIYISELYNNPDVQYVVRKRTGGKKEWFHKSCLYSIWGNKKERSK